MKKKEGKKEVIPVEEKKELTQQVTVPATAGQLNIDGLLQTAIQQGVSVEQMRELLEMGKEMKRELAKEEFNKAMAAFQAECPVVKRKKEGSVTKKGVVAFKYAPLEDIVIEVKPVLAKHGLSYKFKPNTNDAGVVTSVRCYATHIAGHSEYSEMRVERDAKTPLMSESQNNASSITFAKRHAFKNMFGIVDEGEDDENSLPRGGENKLKVPDVEELRTTIEKLGRNEGVIVKKFGVTTLDELSDKEKLILQKSLKLAAEKDKKNETA